MRKLFAAALALSITAALIGGFATTAEPAEAVTVKTHSPGVEGYKPLMYWNAESLRPWYGQGSWVGVGPNGMASGTSQTIGPGQVAVRVEYPGIITSVRVLAGPWRVESKDDISFVITNTDNITVHADFRETDNRPKATLMVEGQVARGFTVAQLVRGPGGIGSISWDGNSFR